MREDIDMPRKRFCTWSPILLGGYEHEFHHAGAACYRVGLSGKGCEVAARTREVPGHLELGAQRRAAPLMSADCELFQVRDEGTGQARPLRSRERSPQGTRLEHVNARQYSGD